jgi:hypothetical protein
MQFCFTTQFLKALGCDKNTLLDSDFETHLIKPFCAKTSAAKQKQIEIASFIRHTFA